MHIFIIQLKGDLRMLGTICGIISAEIAFRAIQAGTGVALYYQIPKLSKRVISIAKLCSRKRKDSAQVFNDICDNYDSFII